MAEKFVAKASEFKDGDRRIVFVGDHEIGVFRHEGQFYAYSNFCLHQGGPACEGLTIAKVEERLRPDKTSQGLYFSETEMHFVCPWHGMEYDMKTGECVSDRKMKLRSYKVLRKGRRGLCRRVRPHAAKARRRFQREAEGRPPLQSRSPSRLRRSLESSPATGRVGRRDQACRRDRARVRQERRGAVAGGDADADERAVPGLCGAGRERRATTRRSRKGRW